MEKVENGHFVSVLYKGTLQNGEVFDRRIILNAINGFD